MTNREFFEMVINGTLNDEVIAHAHNAIEKLDARNAKRRETPSKKEIENAPIIAKIAELLTNEPTLASEIAKSLKISTQKASALVKKVADVKVKDVKVKGKGTQKGYYL